MKRMVSLLLTLVLALLLAGCGGNAAAAADSAAAPRDNGSGYWNTTADTDSISEDQNMAYEAEEPGASAYNDSKAQSDRPAKKVYTGYMEMQTLDFDKAGDIDALVKELGGYFQQSSVSNRGNSGYRYGSYTIRIPSAQFDTFLQKAGTLCHLVYSSTGTDDVSETYYDTEARLETARIKLERLQALRAPSPRRSGTLRISAVRCGAMTRWWTTPPSTWSSVRSTSCLGRTRPSPPSADGWGSPSSTACGPWAVRWRTSPCGWPTAGYGCW